MNRMQGRRFLMKMAAPLLALTLWVIARSFLKIATATGSVRRGRFRHKAGRLAPGAGGVGTVGSGEGGVHRRDPV